MSIIRNVDPINPILHETTRIIPSHPQLDCIASYAQNYVDDPTQKVTRAMEDKWVKSGEHLYLEGTSTWMPKRLPRLPRNWKLEQTSVQIPNVSPSDVSKRLSDVLRVRSIESVYNDTKAKARCRTCDGVEFCIRLYRGEEDSEIDRNCIAVEIQHRFGTSYSFYNDAMAILDAAQGEVPAPPQFPQLSTFPSIEYEESEATTIDGTSSIEMAARMLQQRSRDSYNLALHTLASLTNASSMGLETARGVSTSLMHLKTDHLVVSKLLTLIADRKNDSGHIRLRSLALQVVANAFQTLKGHEIPHWWKVWLRHTLLQDLWMAKSGQFNALQAARILEFYVPENIGGSDLVQALVNAWEVGCTKHFALENQARVCLNKLR